MVADPCIHWQMVPDMFEHLYVVPGICQVSIIQVRCVPHCLGWCWETISCTDLWVISCSDQQRRPQFWKLPGFEIDRTIYDYERSASSPWLLPLIRFTDKPYRWLRTFGWLRPIYWVIEEQPVSCFLRVDTIWHNQYQLEVAIGNPSLNQRIVWDKLTPTTVFVYGKIICKRSGQRPHLQSVLCAPCSVHFPLA